MATRTLTVKYYSDSIPRWPGFEVFIDPQSKQEVRVDFVKDDKLGDVAREVPYNIALKMHRSEAYDIIDPETGKVPDEFGTGASPNGKDKPKAPAAVKMSEAAFQSVVEENEQLKIALEKTKKAFAAKAQELQPLFDENQQLRSKIVALEAQLKQANTPAPTPKAAKPDVGSPAPALAKSK